MCTEQRKLATFMFTDMVGYSALTQRNDALAAANVDLGRMNEAHAAADQVLKLYLAYPNNWEAQANLENLSENYKAVLNEGFRKVDLFDPEVRKAEL